MYIIPNYNLSFSLKKVLHPGEEADPNTAGPVPR